MSLVHSADYVAMLKVRKVFATTITATLRDYLCLKVVLLRGVSVQLNLLRTVLIHLTLANCMCCFNCTTVAQLSRTWSPFSSEYQCRFIRLIVGPIHLEDAYQDEAYGTGSAIPV
jgi:hypothetical protein